jgi:hypothetical protein
MFYFKYGKNFSDFNIDGFLQKLSEQFDKADRPNITSRIAVKINIHSSKENRFTNGELENVRGITDEGISGKKITPRNKKVCAVIGFSENDPDEYTPLMEIPLFTYPNPLSLLESFDLK